MKTEIKLNGKEYIFLDWRIKPPGLADEKGIFLQPEAIYGVELPDGDIDIIGIHPGNSIIDE